MPIHKNMRYLVPIVIILAIVAGCSVLLARTHRPVTPLSTPPSTTGTSSTVTATTTPKPLPKPSAQGIVRGQVLLGPTCPVERIPPDPRCAPKPYQTSIRVQSTNPSVSSITITSNASGAFSVSLDPGTYTLRALGGNTTPPTCREMQVHVSSGQTQDIVLECDTGIR